MSPIHYSYEVKIFDLFQHYFEVQLKVTSNKDEVILTLPAWTPGSYMIRDYSTHLYQFSAKMETTGKDLAFEQISLHSWKVRLESNTAIIRYLIYAFEDFTVRTNYLVTDFGFINPAALFLYEEGNLDSKVNIEFKIETHFNYIYTSLARTGEGQQFHASNFDELYDSPFHLSNLNSVFFEVENCKHELIIEGNIPYQFKEKLANDLKIITTKQIQMMGGSPNPYYLFVLNLTQPAYGGLEHMACSINYFSPDQITDPEEYKKLLELLSHEYFHLWNVKRIRPKALGPFDYQSPNLTRELWIAEGATSFYDIYFLYACGFLSKEELINRFQSDIFSMEETDAESWMSLEESSFTAWNKYYKRNGNSHNNSVSYYVKGAILVLCMVIYLLKMTEGKISFLEILQTLYKKYFLEKKRGFTKQEFFDVAKELSGVDLKLEFDRYLTKAIKLPVDNYLNLIGIVRVESDLIADLRFKVKERSGNLYVNKLILGSQDSSFDLQLEDEILAINGKRMNRSSFDRLEKFLKPKERIHILLSRFGMTREIMIECGSIFKTKKFMFSPEVSPEIQRVQDIFFLQK